MSLAQIAEWIEHARHTPVRPWQQYALETIPFVVYTDDEVTYINHPNPPAERPTTLMAATATDIGGVQTATLPAYLCTSEAETVPLAYHEGFHVYQAAHFTPTPTDMFTAIAYAPELNVEYRALCRIEAAILNDTSRTPQEKLAILAAVIRQRRPHLLAHESLLTYERYLERNEGTAAFVEQTARLALYGVTPPPVEVDYGWARYYKAGSAICWLLEAAASGWQARIESGESLSDIVFGMFPDDAEFRSSYGWDEALAVEREAVEALRAELQQTAAPLDAPDALVIHYPAQGQVMRAFTPNTMRSLGDGRILHRTMYKLLLPAYGHAAADGVPVIDDIVNRRVLLPARDVEYDGETLTVHADGIDVSLKNVRRHDDGSYRIVT